jgi:hypothetical protein
MTETQVMDRNGFLRSSKVGQVVESVLKSFSNDRLLEELSDPNGMGARRAAAVMLPRI